MKQIKNYDNYAYRWSNMMYSFHLEDLHKINLTTSSYQSIIFSLVKNSFFNQTTEAQRTQREENNKLLTECIEFSAISIQPKPHKYQSLIFL
jgi:hypothetical protein